MGRKVDWRKASRIKPGEDKFAGSIKADGVRVAGPRQDSLAKRAERAAAAWAKTLSTKDRLSVPPPSPYDWSVKKLKQQRNSIKVARPEKEGHRDQSNWTGPGVGAADRPEPS